jgi:transcriptional regulator with XRE-family HTH domain
MKDARPFFEKLLKDPEIRMHFEKRRAKRNIALAVQAARKRAHLTQVALAKKAGTTQAVIARLESGKDSRVPSMPLLSTIAAACGATFEFAFSFKKVARSKGLGGA